MSAITGTRIDQVLHDAVESGAVPNVVAMAANEDGPIYEGAAGPRAVGEPDPVTPDTIFRIASMTKMVATTAALQLVEQGELDLDAPVETYRPEFADLQVLEGFDGDTPRLRAPKSKATVRQLITHTSASRTGSGTQDIVRWEAVTGTPNVLSGDAVIFTAPLVADPGTTLRVRHQHGLARPGRRGGERAVARRLHRRAHPRARWAWSTRRSLMSDEQRANSVPVHLHGEDGSWAATERRLGAGAGLVGRRPRPVLDAARLPALPADAARRRHARRRADPQARDRRRGVHEPDRRARLPAGDQDRRPAARPPTSTAARATSAASGCCSTPSDSPGCARPAAAPGPGIFNTHFWVDRKTGVTGAIYSQTLPFVEPAVFQVYIDFEKALYASL